ncbi:MAG: sigma-70 family RNA polymerase sigma factor [Planctomycetota bacterium]
MTTAHRRVPTSLEPAELIERHQKGIWRYLRMLGCDAATADDLTQETFLRVLRRSSFVQHSDAATSEYLRRTAYNLLISDHRKHGRMHLSDSPMVLDQAWQRWAGKDLCGDVAVDALTQCMERLTDRAKAAIEMRYAGNIPRAEIGAALGITDHGARNILQRAKAQLRECVTEKLRLN